MNTDWEHYDEKSNRLYEEWVDQCGLSRGKDNLEKENENREKETFDVEDLSDEDIPF